MTSSSKSSAWSPSSADLAAVGAASLGAGGRGYRCGASGRSRPGGIGGPRGDAGVAREDPPQGARLEERPGQPVDVGGGDPHQVSALLRRPRRGVAAHQEEARGPVPETFRRAPMFAARTINRRPSLQPVSRLLACGIVPFQVFAGTRFTRSKDIGVLLQPTRALVGFLRESAPVREFFGRPGPFQVGRRRAWLLAIHRISWLPRQWSTSGWTRR